MLRTSALYLAVVSTAVLLLPGEAGACAAPQCYPGQFAPEEGLVIPANAPALVLVTDQLYFQPAPEPGVSLHVSNGREVPVQTIAHPEDPRTLLVFPEDPLSGETEYVVRYTKYCDRYAPIPDGEQTEVRFRTAQASRAPTSAGALGASFSVESEWRVPTVAGSCSTNVKAAVAHLEITPSAELTPYLPLTRWHVAVDGFTWGKSRWGGWSADGLQGPVVYGIPSAPPGKIHAQCEPYELGSDRGVTEGTHVVTVTAEIAGRGTLPPLAATIDLRCDGSSSQLDGGYSQPDGGSSQSDGGTDQTTLPHAGRHEGDAMDGWGCTSTGALLPALSVLLLGLRRRRR